MAAIYKPARILEEPALDKQLLPWMELPDCFWMGTKPTKATAWLALSKLWLRKKLSINKLVRSAMAGILLSNSLSFFKSKFWSMWSSICWSISWMCLFNCLILLWIDWSTGYIVKVDSAFSKRFFSRCKSSQSTALLSSKAFSNWICSGKAAKNADPQSSQIELKLHYPPCLFYSA